MYNLIHLPVDDLFMPMWQVLERESSGEMLRVTTKTQEQTITWSLFPINPSTTALHRNASSQDFSRLMSHIRHVVEKQSLGYATAIPQ